jgi:hypothetical protein
MTAPKPIEVENYGLDFPFVIVGAHLTLDEARARFGEDYNAEIGADEIATINAVKHCWVRYEIIGEGNCPDDYEPEPGLRLWMLHEQTRRPGGVVRKATVVNPP